MKVNIYEGRPGYDAKFRDHKVFYNYLSAERFCKYIAPKLYGPGEYHFVVVK